MKHDEPSPLSGTTVKIKSDITHPQIPDFGGSEYRIEDWWDRVSGGSWKDATGNPACIVFAVRMGLAKHDVPIDDEVLFGKIESLGHLVHISELELPTVNSKGK